MSRRNLILRMSRWMRDWRMVICRGRESRGLMGISFGLLRPGFRIPNYMVVVVAPGRILEDTESLQQKSLASIPAMPG